MNSSNAMLYTRRVIGEETLSSTSAFSLRQSAAPLPIRDRHDQSFAAAVIAPLLGYIGSRMDISSGWWRDQVKLPRHLKAGRC
jgi:hypothetical protein